MKLDIVLPTKNRKEKLENCLNSIFLSAKDIEVQVYVYFSIKEEFDYYRKLFHKDLSLPIGLAMLEEYRVPEFWNTHLSHTSADAMCYVNDDILFYEDTIQVIMEEFEERFPDYDGVMGLRQANLPQNQAVEGAFGVIGLPYKKRFPNGKVWCPDYERFYADFELWKYARSIGKFYFCTPARIKHLHPITDRSLEDDTHKDVRRWIAGDKRTFNLRQHRNLLWGKSFELVNTGSKA